MDFPRLSLSLTRRGVGWDSHKHKINLHIGNWFFYFFFGENVFLRSSGVFLRKFLQLFTYGWLARRIIPWDTLSPSLRSVAEDETEGGEGSALTDWRFFSSIKLIAFWEHLGCEGETRSLRVLSEGFVAVSRGKLDFYAGSIELWHRKSSAIEEILIEEISIGRVGISLHGQGYDVELGGFRGGQYTGLSQGYFES